MVKGGTITPFMPQINNNNLAKKRSSLGIFDGKKKSVKPLDIQFVSPFKVKSQRFLGEQFKNKT